MKHISKNSQKGIQYLHAFNVAKQKEINSLHRVYAKCSTDKIRAFYRCEKKRQTENATSDGYIITHNANFFSYAFTTPEGLRIETAHNSYIIY